MNSCSSLHFLDNLGQKKKKKFDNEVLLVNRIKSSFLCNFMVRFGT